MLTSSAAIDERIRRLLPFRLTADQDRAVAEVCRDLAVEKPMQRLLQADVGAGKTAVAVYALLVTVANKHQAALIAPPRACPAARSDARPLSRPQSSPPSSPHWRTVAGRTTDALAALAAGEIDLVVGTQALVQEDVRFAQLGLVVIDEQHKFGVHQAHASGVSGSILTIW